MSLGVSYSVPEMMETLLGSIEWLHLLLGR